MTVEPFRQKAEKKPTPHRDEKWLRRQAMALAVQLPDCEADALAVLAYASELVRFIAPTKPV